jgi:hypothetical protein
MTNMAHFQNIRYRNHFRTIKHVVLEAPQAAATPPNQPQRCILRDYFNNYNFSKLK